ncbi:MAG: type II secretion system F family protein [Leptolinea sp.]|jgi:tight adherence protein C|nr:type II secretion system F family protein [Leptolinea sp.]
MDNFLIGFLVLIVIVLIIAIILVVIGLRNPSFQNNRILQERLEEMTVTGEVVNLEKIELSLPFSERVIYPVARKLGEIAIRFTPQNALQNTSKKLELAGSPGKLDPTMMMALQFISFVFFGGLLFLVFTVAKVNWPMGLIILIVLLFSILGFFIPQLLLSSAINRRQKNIRRAMPDALDLLTICVEAGLGFDAAMSKVAEKWETELSLSFARAIREIQLGKLRREALRAMADRIGIPEMTSFVAAVIQSEQLGVSLAKVLRIQSDQMRIRRRQLAEEEAHKVPIKMLVPMGLLIFPSLMIVLLTPAAFRLLHSALGGMFK